MYVNLVQTVIFHSTAKKRTCRRNVALVKFPGKIGARSEESWENVALIVPPVCSSSVSESCRIIKISYYLHLCIDAGGFSISKELSLPVLIGTIPLPDMAYHLSPTYQESIFTPSSTKIMSDYDYDPKAEMFESDINTFKPHYPYYKDYSTLNQPPKYTDDVE